MEAIPTQGAAPGGGACACAVAQGSTGGGVIAK